MPDAQPNQKRGRWRDTLLRYQPSQATARAVADTFIAITVIQLTCLHCVLELHTRTKPHDSRDVPSCTQCLVSLVHQLMQKLSASSRKSQVTLKVHYTPVPNAIPTQVTVCMRIVQIRSVLSCMPKTQVIHSFSVFQQEHKMLGSTHSHSADRRYSCIMDFLYKPITSTNTSLKFGLWSAYLSLS